MEDFSEAGYCGGCASLPMHVIVFTLLHCVDAEYIVRVLVEYVLVCRVGVWDILVESRVLIRNGCEY